MKFKPLACGFHSHTDMSLDGGSTVEGKIKNAATLGRVADCVTDHGIMSAIVPHWSAAEKLYKDKKIATPIKSIHGIEAYIIDPDRPPKVLKNGREEPQYMHLTIHFKTAKAYQYFCALTPKMEERAIVRWAERKPLLRLEELEPISSEITLGSGCLVGPVAKNVLLGRSDLAEKMFVRLMNLVGKDNFFAEVFPHIIDKEWKKPERNENNEIVKPGEFVPVKQRRDLGAIDPPFEPDPCSGLIDIQKWPNEFVRRLAAKYGVRCVISLDDHYACMEDKVVQEARLGNGTENWKFYGLYYSATTEYCAEQLQKQLGVSDKTIEEWVDNSYYFVDRFRDYKLETSKDRWILPTTEMVYGINTPSKDKLAELVKIHGRMPAEDDPKYKIYKERFDYEVSVLTENGVADFLPYFFVLEDAARYAKANGIMYNTRGSAGGSLVLYLIGVSITDPVKYDLPFERFLTLGRIKSGSLPDIDSDWQDRSVVLEYLAKKYGNKMALIATDMMLRLKTSILDTERAQNGFVSLDTSMMCRTLKGAAQGQTDKDWLFGYRDKSTGEQIKGFWDDQKHPGAAQLRAWAEKNPKMWETVLKCIGICKTRGVHAGGIVLSPDEIQKYVPLIHTKQGFATAYSMKPIETIGLVKYDFLGVKTLKAQGISIKSINEHHPDVKIEWGEFPHDPRVYKEIISKDLLAGIFQMSGGAVRSVATQINPKSIIDIALWISLMRPGAMDAPSPDPSDKSDVTAAMYYIKCAQGLRKPYFIHPDLETILGETYGVIVTQEQGLKLFRVLADYTYETAEVVRRAIGKKEKDLLTIHSAALKQKCIERGWTEEQAQKLYESIEASARYSFNCIDGDQRVVTDRGLMEMSEVVADYDSVKVLTYQNDGSFGFAPVGYGQFMGNKEVYEIGLEDGTSIAVTLDHMLKSNGLWRSVEDIVKSDGVVDVKEDGV